MYALIENIDRELFVTMHDLLEDAQDAMAKRFNEFPLGEEEKLGNVYACKRYKNEYFDWKIIEVKGIMRIPENKNEVYMVFVNGLTKTVMPFKKLSDAVEYMKKTWKDTRTAIEDKVILKSWMTAEENFKTSGYKRYEVVDCNNVLHCAEIIVSPLI